MEYHIMGFVSQIRLKPGCIPSKFECQPSRQKRICCSIKQRYVLQKQKKMTTEECLNESIPCTITSFPQSSVQDTSNVDSGIYTNAAVIFCFKQFHNVPIFFRNGLVNYNSAGSRRWTTNTYLVDTCDFKQCLKRDLYVKADRLLYLDQYCQPTRFQLVWSPYFK